MVKEQKPDAPLAVIGNKCDLERKVQTEVVSAYCSQAGILFFEASAKDGTGVQAAFQKFVEQMFTVEAEKKPTAAVSYLNSI